MARSCTHSSCPVSFCDPNVNFFSFHQQHDDADIDAEIEQHEQQRAKRSKIHQSPRQFTRYHDPLYHLEDNEWCKENKCRSSCHGCNKSIAKKLDRMGEHMGEQYTNCALLVALFVGSILMVSPLEVLSVLSHYSPPAAGFAVCTNDACTKDILSKNKQPWCEACAVAAGVDFTELFEPAPAGQKQRTQRPWSCLHCDPTKACTPSCSSLSHRGEQAAQPVIHAPVNPYHTAAPAPSPAVASLEAQLAAAMKQHQGAGSGRRPGGGDATLERQGPQVHEDLVITPSVLPCHGAPPDKHGVRLQGSSSAPVPACRTLCAHRALQEVQPAAGTRERCARGCCSRP